MLPMVGKESRPRPKKRSDAQNMDQVVQRLEEIQANRRRREMDDDDFEYEEFP